MTKPRFFLILVCLGIFGCSSVYYSAMEKFGVQKRDLLVSRVKSARDSQKDAQEQFKTALQSFKEVTQFDGGDLEKIYKKLKSQLEISEGKSDALRNRIESVESVANALFTEWKGELKSYSNENLRQVSQQELQDTQKKYGDMLRAMKKAESRIEPVLQPLRDQVLFLKHNLNARAIGSLNREVTAVQSDVTSLLEDLQASINEANSFIDQLGK
jgi:septation ring formation regulator EzrA